MSEKEKEHISWVDFSKGICMIGVVLMYTSLKLEDVGYVRPLVDFMKPFRMPDFFLLSGLFLASTLKRPWRDYIDKRVVHYLYFFVLWTLIFFLFRAISLRIGLFQSAEEEQSLFYYFREPYAMLWFIQLLPVLCVFTRMTVALPASVLIAFGILLQSFPLEYEHWGLVKNFCERFIYFYIGYYCAPFFFSLAQRAQQSTILSLIGLILWAGVNWFAVHAGVSEAPILSLSLGLAGAMATVVAGSLLSKASLCLWIRYLGRQSLVVYLGFYLPLMCIVPIVQKIRNTETIGAYIDSGSAALTMGVLSVVCALAVYHLTKRGPLSFLFARPKWAMLPAATIHKPAIHSAARASSQ